MTMHCLKFSRSLVPSFAFTFPSRKHSLPSNLRFRAAATTAMSSSKIEHIVLFNVKPQADPSKMLTSLNALVSLHSVLHLTAAPLHKLDASPFPFNHILHAQYSSKEALAEYTDHPLHVSAVQNTVRPICDDVMAIDWVSSPGPPAPPPGSAVRVTFLKLKEGLGKQEKDEVFEAIKGVKERFKEVESLSYGENFSSRAKGYEIASLAVFKGLEELNAVVEKEKEVNELKDKVREYLASVIVLDFVVPGSGSSSL